MDVSIILATHKRPETLHSVLTSFCDLEHNGLEWEIVVVDNAGGDEAKSIIDQFTSRLPVILVVEPHLGKSNALNAAMAKATGTLFLFTDDDVTVDSKWLIHTWEGAQQRPQHSVFGGKLLPMFPEGMDLSNLGLDLNHALVKGCFCIADSEKEDDEFPPWKIYGANWAIKSEVFRLGYAYRTEIGPGTELVVGEETELACRLHKAGFALAYLPRSVVYHQIIPEQLSVGWIYKRVFKSGRSWALSGGLPDVPLLFGVPRYLYKSVVLKYLQYMGSYFRFNRQTRFDYGIKYWFERGYFYQFWKGLLPEDKSAQKERN